MSVWSIAVLMLAAAVAPGLACADIYSYTDSTGVRHFTDVPGDSRYKLLIAAPPDPDATPSKAAAASPKGKSIDLVARSAQYDDVIDAAAKAAKTEANLVRAVIVVGSGFNPHAVSKQGKVGLMQLTPATAKRYGVTNVYDPEQNVRAGAHYLSDLLVRFDSNLELALAAYDAGEVAVERYGRRVPPFPETLEYIPSVMRVYQRLMDQAPSSKNKSQAKRTSSNKEFNLISFLQLFLVILVVIYFFPTFVAFSRKHHNAGAICAFNFFLGWTFIGWVAALVWALARPVPTPATG